MPNAQLCVTVTGSTMAELRARRDQVAGADLVELRLDSVSDPSAAGAVEGRRVPVIVTCRARWEGGLFAGSEEERWTILREAQRLGAEYVDVEWKSGFFEVIERRRGRGVVVSHHDFDGVPADLDDKVRAMRATGAEVVKIAVMARRLRDTLPLFAVARAQTRPVVALAMGDAGIVSRVLAARFGSAWTYAGDAVAPGQLTPDRMRGEFSFAHVSADTALYGVVGRPIMHSLSPVMHNAAFRSVGIDAVYVPLAAADFDDFLSFAEVVDVKGASVTAPFKLAAFECANDVDPTSQRVQSTNTLKRVDGRWCAANTDVAGFLSPLEGAPLRGKRVTVLGAGGAARAVSLGLASVGARVTIVARRADRAAFVASRIGAAVGAWPPPANSWDLLVNATPVGTSPDIAESPLPGGPFDGHLVYDLVYNPFETRLLREARAAGCRTIGGLAMLVGQAQQQFEWWTGERIDPQVMRDAAINALAAKAAAAPAPADAVEP
jgi:3-dehydroquinate dehydratase/shikimate dehydrogenase